MPSGAVCPKAVLEPMMCDVYTYLSRDPFTSISLLKYLQSYPQDTESFHVRGEEGEAVLVLLQVAASPYDRETYPGAAFVCFIASDGPNLTRRLLDHVPCGVSVVFKLAAEADRAVVAEGFDLRRTTSFLSFTGSFGAPSLQTDPRLPMTDDPLPQAWSLLEARGYQRDWLMPLLASGHAFVVEDSHGDDVASVCFAFQNHGHIWEVGGLSTRPDRRRQGHAARVVGSAIAELARRGVQGRYVVEETNRPSVQLAQAIGLQHVLTLTHFLASAPCAGDPAIGMLS
ncbi:FR47-like protein [Rhizobium sp. RU35A]|nr:FR47-like protein [Rhizobium sp. RU35A]